MLFQLVYQEMRSAYNAQKKPLDKMKEQVKQLLEELEEPVKRLSMTPSNGPVKKADKGGSKETSKQLTKRTSQGSISHNKKQKITP